MDDRNATRADHPPILIPRPDAAWCPTITTFALTWNGYDRFGPLPVLGAAANEASERWRATRELPSDLPTLRSFLFFEQRRWRHLLQGPWLLGSEPIDEPVGEARAYIEALLRRIRAIAGPSVPGPPDELP